MTPEAAEILKAAVNPDSGGQILYIKHGFGPGHDNIQVGRAKRHMIPDDADSPTVQRWLNALWELVVGGYVSGSGTVYHVTENGRKAADALVVS